MTAQEEISAGLDVLVQAVRAVGGKATTSTFTYDDSGNIDTITENIGGNTKTTTIAYAEDGSVSSVVTVFTGTQRTETFSYDGDGVLQSITAAEVAI